MLVMLLSLLLVVFCVGFVWWCCCCCLRGCRCAAAAAAVDIDVVAIFVALTHTLRIPPEVDLFTKRSSIFPRSSALLIPFQAVHF